MAKKGSSNRFNKVKFEIAKLNYIDLKAPKSYQEAQSGQKMYENLSNMNFVINGKEVSSRDILSEIQQKSDDNERDYHSLLTEAFRKTFKDAGAEVPNELILKELITSCYQYQSFINTKVLFNSNLTAVDRQKDTIHINCNDSNCAELKVNREQGVIFTDKQDSWKDNSIPFSSSLEFKLKSKNEEVEYTDGKLSLTLTPKSIEVEQDRSLFSRFVEAVRALLQKAFGRENVKEANHEFEFYEPKSIVDSPQVENANSKNQHIH